MENKIKTGHTCKHCGLFECNKWVLSMQDELNENQLCFKCNFWNEKVNYVDDPRSVRADGVHYFIHKESNENNGFKGFGGRKFIIKFFDGREVMSCNVWCQGMIPKEWKNLLPDNASINSVIDNKIRLDYML